jgi:hypothetical protein
VADTLPSDVQSLDPLICDGALAAFRALLDLILVLVDEQRIVSGDLR